MRTALKPALSAAILCLAAALGCSTPPLRPEQEYRGFEGATFELIPWEGRNLALLAPKAGSCGEEEMERIVGALDGAYDVCLATVGRRPKPHMTWRGKLSIAVVPKSCAPVCGSTGLTGIEIEEPEFQGLCQGVKERGELDPELFHELGRGFWVLGDRLGYPNEATIGTIREGFAVLMRTLSMEAAELKAGELRPGVPYAELIAGIQGLHDQYVADRKYHWANTLKTGKAPPNRLGLGGAELFASIFLHLRKENGPDFPRRFFVALARLPKAGTFEEANENWVRAASTAAGKSLRDYFARDLKFPLKRK